MVTVGVNSAGVLHEILLTSRGQVCMVIFSSEGNIHQSEDRRWNRELFSKPGFSREDREFSVRRFA